MTTTKELIELADEYARCNANHHVEDMYGTSKGYTAECKSFSDEARARLLQAIESLSAEVERLKTLGEMSLATLQNLQGVSDEYNAWILCHAAGGDYDDFLKRTLESTT